MLAQREFVYVSPTLNKQICFYYSVKIHVIFGVRFQRRKVDKKVGLDRYRYSASESGRYQLYRVVSGIADTVGRRCNDNMPKYCVDRLISLPAAMAANGVYSSMHNQPCAIMLFTAFYNDLPRRATTIARQPSPAGRPQAKFQEIRRT